jgi:hypothetical protein
VTDTIYKGAIKQEIPDHNCYWTNDYLIGTDEWQLTNDDEKLLAADETNVIWASTYEQLRIELEDRYPCEHPGLSRIYRFAGPDRLYVYPHPVPDTDSADHTEIWRAVRRAGTICIAQSQSYAARNLQRDKQFDGCVFRFPLEGPATITYDPKKAASIKARRAKKRRDTQVTVDEIATLMRALEQATDPPFPRPGTYGASDRKTYVTFLMARLVVFNVLYGKSAHRRFKPWQEFVALWRERKEASDRVYNAAQLNAFVKLMGRECLAKPVPALPSKHFSDKGRPKEIRLP